MKKFKKLTAIILILLVCLSLCSCAELDELKDKQAFQAENGIIYKDNLYKLIDTKDNLYYDFNNQTHLNVTEPDVPVLLSGYINLISYYINNDKTIIVGGYDERFYVREDKYSQYEQSIKNGINYTDIGFYYNFEIDGATEYILSEAEKQVLLNALSSEPYNESMGIDDELYLFTQSDDGLFRKSQQYSIIDSTGLYYIAEYNENGYVTNVYRLPYDKKEMFKDFFDRAYYIVDYGY